MVPDLPPGPDACLVQAVASAPTQTQVQTIGSPRRARRSEPSPTRRLRNFCALDNRGPHRCSASDRLLWRAAIR